MGVLVVLILIVFCTTFAHDHYDFVKYIGQWSPRFQRRYVEGTTLYDICQNKYESYLFVKKLGIPVPRLYYYGALHRLDFN